MLESGTTVETETRDAGYSEFNRQHVTRLARWVVTWCTVDCPDRAFRKRLCIKAGRSFRIFVVPNTDRVLGHCASCRFRLHVTCEVVEDGLPPGLLLLDGMRRLAVEGDAAGDAFRAGRELDRGLAIAECVFDPLVLDELRIGTREVKTHAAVLGLHARGEGSALAQVDRCFGRVPVVGRGIPLHNVVRRGVSAPNLLDGGGDSGLNFQSHGGTSSFVVSRFKQRVNFPSCYKDGRGQSRPTSPA